MAHKKNLTFRSVNLGADTTLMLAFASSGSPDTTPIAWKLTTLAAQGRSVLRVTYAHDLAVSVAQVGSGQLVTAGNYTPIKEGQSSSLQVNDNSDPPVYTWSAPRDVGVGNPNQVQAVNATPRPASIGLGFITDLDTDREQMETVTLSPMVAPGAAFNSSFNPTLSAYATSTYKQNQVIASGGPDKAPIWQANLLSLGSDTSIIITRDSNGDFHAKQVALSIADDEE